MIVSRAPRNPALTPFVDALWVHKGELPHRGERLLPSGRLQLLINLHADELCDYSLDGRPANWTRGAALQGARIEPILIDTAHQRDICGVSFAVGGQRPFFGMPASEVCGRVLNLSDVWGGYASLLRERLLEADDAEAQLDVLESALLERGASFDQSQDVQFACRALERGASVRAVGDRLGLTPRRLIGLFRAHLGFPPKMFARLARFQAVLRASKTPWVDIAAANGFADQAHMIREFRFFSGSSPREHRARSSGATHHVPLSGRQFCSIRRDERSPDFGHDQP
jgi:AraC-like DNA-binding protein